MPRSPHNQHCRVLIVVYLHADQGKSARKHLFVVVHQYKVCSCYDGLWHLRVANYVTPENPDEFDLINISSLIFIKNVKRKLPWRHCSLLNGFTILILEYYPIRCFGIFMVETFFYAQGLFVRVLLCLGIKCKPSLLLERVFSYPTFGYFFKL